MGFYSSPDKIVIIIHQAHYFIKTLCFIFALILLITGALAFQKHSLEIISCINELGWFAPILFILTYTLATILFLPTMVLTLAGGALFGPVAGTVINLLGASSGAAFSFLITRHLAYDWCFKKRGARLSRMILGVEKKGWIFVALIRLFPVIPFNLVNYGLGVTAIPFRLYLITTMIFLIPTEILYTYFGYAGMGVLSEPERFYKSGGIVLLSLALMALIAVKIKAKRYSKRQNGVPAL